ncbi:hypothetical protein L596_028481 [Steinernema carpocapsae]|uniref:Uncharacterized protein n=1 Tax=Steinernema carpocapsae TaxID=34508 RepID=A0A4U5LZH8_STECR|nr:hypothetical protein L596_028481 [Steinernema carpocapsae]
MSSRLLFLNFPSANFITPQRDWPNRKTLNPVDPLKMKNGRRSLRPGIWATASQTRWSRTRTALTTSIPNKYI